MRLELHLHIDHGDVCVLMKLASYICIGVWNSGRGSEERSWVITKWMKISVVQNSAGNEHE